jgi:D-alanyl-lipoteichoic acid acyltransferase DltB (MBOAT superfamily)
MGLVQIGASILASLLTGALTRFSQSARAARIHLLLAFSVLAVYWFQPLVPLRSLDFWLPSLTLALVLLTWFVTTQSDSPLSKWYFRENLIGLLIIVGLPAVIALTRYFLPNPVFTAAPPPRFILFLAFVFAFSIFILLIRWLSRRFLWILSAVIILLITILIILKMPALSLQTSVLLRTLTNRSIENAAFTDLRWLGISYVAFRLIHVLRDKQTGRLPEVSLSEFATYVVFYPSLAAGPIDRVERFTQDLRKEFFLTQEETLIGGQRILLGLFKKFVIADALALIALNDALAAQVRTTGWMWIVVYAYAFQIYFDFSGYTDIAIGIARLVGVKLPENFAAPYLKPNLTQFWNSWHMTLTQWFRSYFFNPFNRWIRGFKNMPAWRMMLISQVATMVLIGFWHGITMNYIFWGFWHGLAGVTSSAHAIHTCNRTRVFGMCSKSVV